MISGTIHKGVVLLLDHVRFTIGLQGGSFTYLRVEFRDFIAFIVVGNILFKYIVADASVASEWAFKGESMARSKSSIFKSALSLSAEHLSIWVAFFLTQSRGFCFFPLGSFETLIQGTRYRSNRISQTFQLLYCIWPDLTYC
ncbi:hypothetical protein NE237_010549 [Protea cynaroides]|uniref:Uncharacterized protein n=1 Tax=Protea cynaroides TaxID=273540 RepID=A0A9Q0R1P1_9MAGN|nr:hypothetical protein NE237_010549 [Protea cynaroides]